MQGLRTQENEKFLQFFALVQEEAKKQNCVFFLESGEGKEIVTDTLNCENLSGWLIPNDKVKSFENIFTNHKENDNWNSYIAFADWEKTQSGIKTSLRRINQK